MISVLQSLLRLVRPLPDRIRELPILVLMPHGGCNCRCVMCDIWKTGEPNQELPVELVAEQLASLRELETRWVITSGGEPLLHSRLEEIWELLRQLPVRQSLLSNGLLLADRAREIVRFCDEVIVSLDGPEAVHDAIRGLPGAFRQLAAGVESIRALDQGFRITARCTLQKANFASLPLIIDAAHELGLDQISFLAVDVTSRAFNRQHSLATGGRERMLLDTDEIAAFGEILERTRDTHQADFRSAYIAESFKKLTRLHRHFEAALGRCSFSAPACNAPWVSAVIEADGSVRPCFFHAAYGNLRHDSLAAILNSPDAISFRRRLQVKRDPTCRACVCPLYLRSTAAIPVAQRSS